MVPPQPGHGEARHQPEGSDPDGLVRIGRAWHTTILWSHLARESRRGDASALVRVAPMPLTLDESNPVGLLLPSARSPEGDRGAIGLNDDRL